MDQGEPQALNMKLPVAVALAAKHGDIDAVREWLANGGAPNAIGPNGYTLLAFACVSSRPSCAAVAELLCAAGARDDDGSGVGFAAFHGALDTVRVLLSYGAPVNATLLNGTTALHQSVMAYDWSHFRDGYSRANAQAAASIGHQGIVRLLLKHGAAVNARTSNERHTTLMNAAQFSGFISLGIVKELLSCGADLDLVSRGGYNAEAILRARLSFEIYTGEGIPERPGKCRRPGAVEAFLALLADVRAAGSWKRYANAPRIDVIVLQRLCAAGRASPPPALARLFPTSTKSPPLPREMVWHILSFWRTDRDP